MAQNPKYDNDVVNLGYLNKRLGQTEESINKNNNSISQLPKNYSIPPNPPYYKDSLLCYKNKIYKCNTTKLNGVFSWNDWTIAATDDTTLSNFINNTYELEKLEIQEQIDGKVQTYYQEMDPSNEWTTDLEKSKHIGDYWYNTTNNTQWRYNRNTTTTPITYGWGQVNVPNSVFDLIDKKKSIYTIKPTSYKKDDLWIIEDTLSDEDLPTGTEDNPIAKGDWVFSVANSDTYNKEHWIKRDEDISLSYLEQHYYTIGDIDSSFKELERNTDSKITKAKEEISLNVSQTYTTKEEHTKAINDFDKQIGTINDTITTHETNISNLNVGVEKISASVESIESKTEELSVDIDGVKKNIIPTSTVSGSNIHIEDASDKKMVNFEIDGRSTQKTRSGKNLYKYDVSSDTETKNGITRTINSDGSITFKGTSTGNPTFYINSANPITDFTNYIFSIKTIHNFPAVLRLQDISGGSSYYQIITGNNNVAFNYNDGRFTNNNYRLMVWFNSSVCPIGTEIDFTIYPMLEKGTEATKYEQYGVSPSPDYPSEIESVGTYNEETGKYEIEVKNNGNNLYNSATKTDNSTLTWAAGVEYSETGSIATDFIDISNINNIASNYRFTIMWYDNDKNYLGNSATVTTGIGVYYYDISKPDNSDIVYCRLAFRKNFNNGVDMTTVADLMVCKTLDETTTYEEYKSNSTLFSLDQPLRSLPNGTKDIAYIKNNILYVDRYVAENNINIISITTLSNGNIGGVARPTGKIKTGSNHLICSNAVVNKTIQDGTCYENPTNVVFVGNSTDTLDTIKAKYDGGILYYELAEPYTEKIGEVEIPSTFKGVNNIITTDELEPVMNIEYVRDTILSDYVEGQVGNAVAIQERKNAEFQITNEEIKSSVSNISTDLDGTKSSLNSVEEKITSQEKTINIISKNIDGTTGDIREVTTTTGFTFNKDGMTIDDGSGFKAEHRAEGTYYKDGTSTIGQYTKDGSKQKDLQLFGVYSYGMEGIDDTPMFIAQLFTDANGEECFGHFYNRGD